MAIEDLFIWYQQKIGTYDKQQWETKIEQRQQRCRYEIKNVQLRSTKPNTDLIDLDLVRGSTFTKTKPQHGFITVAKQATFRSVFLPFYYRWWIKQTSKLLFISILVLYLAQLFNIYIYFIHIKSQTLSCWELFVPIIIMWVLTLLHSQIVATNSSAEKPVSERKSSRKSPRQLMQRLQRRLQRIWERLSDRKKIVDAASASNQNIKKLKFNEVVSVESNTPTEHFSNRLHVKTKPNARPPTDDDGFESLNGNGSRTSEEEIVPTVPSQEAALNRTNESQTIEEEDLIVEEDSDKYISCKQCNDYFKQMYNRTRKKSSAKKWQGSRGWSSDSESDQATSVHPYKGKRRSHNVSKNNVLWIDTCDTEDDISPSCRLLGGDVYSEYCSSDSVSDTEIEKTPDYRNYDNDIAPSVILNRPSVVVSCILWKRNDIKKADLTMLDISSVIIGKVDSMPMSRDYFYIGMLASALLAFLPAICRFCENTDEQSAHYTFENFLNNIKDLFVDDKSLMANIYFKVLRLPRTIVALFNVAIGVAFWERIFVIVATCQRLILSAMVFFLLAVAERTFKQRLLYAKLFSHLTSSRLAKLSELPHFRLNKVCNIKTWLSVRSYLKKRGPQRSVDVIVSTAFIVNLLLLTFLCVELLKETVALSQYYLEALVWCLGLGILLLRFMTLGTKINKKYRNLSVLITEQINLHLKIEQKPKKKDELNVANNVLKLAIDLLKELDSPFKISGMSANPILYNVTKLVILSALSGVLSEMLGFKLKLHKIKLK